jgi:hypothetical protein
MMTSRDLFCGDSILNWTISLQQEPDRHSGACRNPATSTHWLDVGVRRNDAMLRTKFSDSGSCKHTMVRRSRAT